MAIIERQGTPLVSVIMPAYNAEAFVEEAVRSVIAQTLEDWELIVIDDCSKDRTYDIVCSLAQSDRRIRVLRNHQNSGVANTRNRGLDLARGKYVALLDSDDYWKTEMLRKMVERAEETRADIIYCGYTIVDEAGRKICDDFRVPDETNLEQSQIRCAITCTTVLLGRRVVDGYRFPTNMYHEDIALWFQLLRDGCTARGVDEVLAAYRQRQDSRAGNKLKSAWRRWAIYRKFLEYPTLKCVRLMIQYGFYGLKKYKRL